MLFLRFAAALLLFDFSLLPARAQYGSLTPDPFDQVEAQLGGNVPESSEAEYEEYSDFPLFVSLSEDLTAFDRFADGGSDSNWYIGFNNAWIIKLPPIPEGDYTRAFIGAKIGRAKTQPQKKRPWERKIIPGKVYMAISQKPAFSSEQSLFLAETSDIPREPHPKLHMKGTGRSRWFWAEIPVNLASKTFPNYLIIWSPTRNFRDALHSPILAAAAAPKGIREGGGTAWNNRSLLGVPPRRESGTLETPISLRPALAIKLTPAPGGGVAVSDFVLTPRRDKMLFRFSTEGKNIELAWIEMSQDELEWRRVSPYRRTPPYFFSLNRSLVPPRGAYFRGRARDILAVEGHGKNIFVPGASSP